jgi:hypothetical protein
MGDIFVTVASPTPTAAEGQHEGDCRVRAFGDCP